MKRFLVVMLVAAACSGEPGATGPEGPGGGAPAPGPQTAPVGLPPEPGDSGRLRILVDASRDGGAWWFPQVAPFSAESGHQGQPLADHMRALGYVVDELPRPFVITEALLERYDVVVRAGEFGTYRETELIAFQRYVERGGKLLLIADHMRYAPPDDVARVFGIEFAGITRGANILDTFEDHAITDGVEPLFYIAGSGIVAYPPAARIIGWLSAGSYLDLNKNELREPDEPSAPAVLGILSLGSGRIVFCGDVNMWEMIPQPLVANTLEWLTAP
jgi:hypothetical protein